MTMLGIHDVIAFAPKFNTKGRKDATGAFQPEARAFLKFHEQPTEHLFLIDNTSSPEAMRQAVISALKEFGDPLCGVAFFCHGTRRGIQLGFDFQTAAALASAIYPDPGHLSVPLYACDTGRDRDANRLDDLEAIGGDGGFADMLRDALCRDGISGCNVDAHTTAGHTTRNPNVRRFRGASAAGGPGGYYIVPQRSRNWKTWRKMLLTTFRYEFPFLDDDDIYVRIG
jgi:hypothetical protein